MATDTCVDVYVPKTSPYTPKTSPYTPICVAPLVGVNYEFMDNVDFQFMDGITFEFRSV